MQRFTRFDAKIVKNITLDKLTENLIAEHIQPIKHNFRTTPKFRFAELILTTDLWCGTELIAMVTEVY